MVNMNNSMGHTNLKGPFTLVNLKRGVNPEFPKFIDRCNFWIFTVTYYIKVYIFGIIESIFGIKKRMIF